MNSLRYWEDQDFSAKENKEQTENVKQILELYTLLSVEDKVEVKKLIRDLNIFS